MVFATLFVEPHPGPLILDKHHMSDFIGERPVYPPYRGPTTPVTLRFERNATA